MNLKEEYSKNPKGVGNPRWLKKHHPDIYNEIVALDAPNFKTQLFMYLNGIQEVPQCPMCGKPTKFNGSLRKFAEYCSIKCAANSTKTRTKYIESCQQKYGTDNISKSDEIKEKKKQTCLKNHGVSCGILLPKTKQTMIERYGSEYPMQSDILRERIMQTCTQKHGGVGGASKNIRRKMEQTSIKRYGMPHPIADESVQQKSHDTKLARYDDGNYNNRSKAHSTMTELYGDIYSRSVALQNHEELIGFTENGDWICRCPHPDCDQCTDKTYITTCNLLYDRQKRGTELCTHLLPKQSTYSSYELTVRNWLDELNITYDSNRRDIIAPKELDIYLPDFNLAIEINGCYWHYTNEKPRNYHMDKYNRCLNTGVRLITLWEDWIQDEPEACRNLILYHLGLIELPELPWDTRLVDLGLGSGPIKEHKTEHGGFECWDAGVFI